MSFRLTGFADLCAKYATWDNLSAFLKSDEGGKLRIVEHPENSLAIIRYTKGVSDFTKEHVGAFRSVVWNKDTNRPVCVAPIKAEETKDFPMDVNVRITDFVDGTMINAFMVGDVIQLATRTSIGATGKFYSERSFAELFNDVFQGEQKAQEFLSSVLEPNTFISFVLQHREHRIVSPNPYNRVYATYFGRIDADGNVSVYSSREDMPVNLSFYVPRVYEECVSFSDPKDPQRRVQTFPADWSWQGMVFQELCEARRWRLRNPAYMVVRALRGAEANGLERFLRLRAAGQVKQYLTYFREEGNTMWTFEQQLRKTTDDLYTAYNEMNKLKTKGMRDLPYNLRPHVYALHGEYLKRLTDPAVSFKSVLKGDVIEYVNKLAVADQAKLMIHCPVRTAVEQLPNYTA